MAAVSGPTQEATGPLVSVPLTLPTFLTTEGEYTATTGIEFGTTNSEINAQRPLLERKREVNSFLPALAAAYACGDISEGQVASFFRHYAHLYTLGIDSNADCNLSCGYCYLSAYNRESVPKYLALEYFERAVAEACAEGVDLIAIVGKEIFADKRGIRLLNTLDHLSCGGQQFRFGFITNGTLIDRFIEHLPRSTSYVDISLDGPARINDAVRGDGVFERAGRNMRALNEAGFSVWTSSVLHQGNACLATVAEFVRVVVNEYGGKNFYFSPVRNFTGSLRPFLLSFEQLARAQDAILNIAETTPGLGTVILDHPYEAVWRDYIWPSREAGVTHIGEFVTDRYGNILRRLSGRCYQKIDVFPHGPWGTCRIDAQGEYLPDVESRAQTMPPSCGSISAAGIKDLHMRAMASSLLPILRTFLENMIGAAKSAGKAPALTSLSIPNWQMETYNRAGDFAI